MTLGFKNSLLSIPKFRNYGYKWGRIIFKTILRRRKYEENITFRKIKNIRRQRKRKRYSRGGLDGRRRITRKNVKRRNLILA
jgi:hypothetical protein